MKKIALIFTGLVKIDQNLVGTAVIYQEIAMILKNQGYIVKMVVPEISSLAPNIASYYQYQDKNNKILIKTASLVIFGAYPPVTSLLEAYRQKKIIMTYLWSIAPIGSLEFRDYKNNDEQAKLHSFISASYNLSLLLSDKIFCRDEGARKLVLGSLTSLGRINLDNYRSDASLRRLVEVAAFGVDNKKLPVAVKDYWQKQLGVKRRDFILIWNGGIWNWNNGETLVKAMNLLKAYNIKLVFQGFKHPESKHALSFKAKKTLNLAKRLGLKDKSIFFGEDWVPYQQRYNFLGSSHAGVVSSPDIPEANLFFKTRIYDYLWAELPVILNDCEAFAPLIKERGLGLVVKTGDAADWAAKIRLLSRSASLRRRFRANIRSYKQEIAWENTLEPIKDFSRRPYAAPDKQKDVKTLILENIRLNRDIVFSF